MTMRSRILNRTKLCTQTNGGFDEHGGRTTLGTTMSATDWYEVLEVNSEVIAKDLTKQYQRMARLHHPDMNGGTKEAEVRFKLITQAYAILSDPVKRRDFDLGRTNRNTKADHTTTRQGPQTPKARGRDYIVPESLVISLGESLTGCTKIHLVKQMSGAPKKLKIVIPPGSSSMKARVSGLGYPSNALGGRPGDLLVPIQVKTHSVFRRADSDLTMTMRISPIEALIGTSIELRDLYNRLLIIKIQSNTRNNSLLVLKGNGVITYKEGVPASKGDLRVKIKIVPIPKDGRIEPSKLVEFNQKLYGRDIRNEMNGR
jgi:curved DNA-binding protein